MIFILGLAIYITWSWFYEFSLLRFTLLFHCIFLWQLVKVSVVGIFLVEINIINLYQQYTVLYLSRKQYQQYHWFITKYKLLLVCLLVLRLFFLHLIALCSNVAIVLRFLFEGAVCALHLIFWVMFSLYQGRFRLWFMFSLYTQASFSFLVWDVWF
jgi:hypothetical protein